MRKARPMKFVMPSPGPVMPLPLKGMRPIRPVMPMLPKVKK